MTLFEILQETRKSNIDNYVQFKLPSITGWLEINNYSDDKIFEISTGFYYRDEALYRREYLLSDEWEMRYCRNNPKFGGVNEPDFVYIYPKNIKENKKNGL